MTGCSIHFCHQNVFKTPHMHIKTSKLLEGKKQQRLEQKKWNRTKRIIENTNETKNWYSENKINKPLPRLAKKKKSEREEKIELKYKTKEEMLKVIPEKYKRS